MTPSAEGELSGWPVPTEGEYPQLQEAVERGWLKVHAHGDYPRWKKALDSLPDCSPSRLELDAPAIRIGSPEDIRDDQRRRLTHALQRLHPWRKGPFDFFGVYVDTEWRSQMKWDRLIPHIRPLRGRHVLDVGCGSGYHGWRMLGAGAASVTGIDPTALFSMQFLAAQRYIRETRFHFWPIGIEAMPSGMRCFDTVFSMGILYHRRSPLEHLQTLHRLLKPGGELVLETLVIEGDASRCLVPQGRYAKMRNVWFIPSPDMLAIWLRRCGFGEIHCVDVTQTTTQEQRSTPWMRFESLADFLMPDEPDKTIEGHPAPHRAILIAEA